MNEPAVRLEEPKFSDLTVVDFPDLAQGCKTYDEFIEKIKDVSETELDEAAEMTVVSKPVLGQIERGQSSPTINILWKISTGLKIPLSFSVNRKKRNIWSPGLMGKM